MTQTQYTLDFDAIATNVPACLRERTQWYAWQYVDRDGKPTKVPISATKGGDASWREPATWSSVTQALDACRRCEDLTGVGFVFSEDDPFTGIDLDKSIDPETGGLLPWAQEIVDRFNSYTEESPSGRGVKIIIKGVKPGGRCQSKNDGRSIEVYDHKRFFTITGNRLTTAPAEIHDRQDELNKFYVETFGSRDETQNQAHVATPNPNAPQDDDGVIRILQNSKCGEAFDRLWKGRWENGDGHYSSQSEADLGLISYLVFVCGNDPPRIDRIFRRSGLMRDKWDRDDYCNRTISKALENRTEFYCGAGDIDVGWEPRWAPSNSTTTKPDDEPKHPTDTTVSNINPTDLRAAVRDPVARAKDGRPYPMTDLGNAERFAARFGDHARYVNGLGLLIWDKTRWRFDDSGEVVRLAAKGVRGILREAAACAEAASTADDDAVKSKLTELAESLTKWARSSESRSRLMAMIDLAQSLAPIAIRVDDLDRDPWLLNCQSGTIDLQTGLIRPHSQRDLITKLAPVAYQPDAQCPVWKAFLQRSFGNNDRMIEFVQRAVGYALSAVIREHVIHVLYGSGANGKSTFIETIATMLGDYATAAAPRLLIRRQGESHPTELVDLREARFVSAIETAEGGAFDEERVKALTGDDRIKARKMRQDFFEFRPTFKLFLATNHRPIVRGDDTGIWRRIRLWPFTVEIPPEEQDHALKEKLRAELAGILAWAIQGCMAWQDDGLSEPPEVTSATKDYRVEQDHFGDWFESCCVVPGENEDAETFHCRGGLLYQSYSVFCRSTGNKPLGMWKFSERLLKRPGVVRDRGRSSNYTGVKLTDEAFAAAEQQEGPRWRG